MKITAYCIRTKMCGGGNSYDVYFRKADKPSYPLHNGHCYETVIVREGKEYFDIRGAIMPKSHWAMDAGMAKWESGKQLTARAKRLAVRIAKRAFPELAGRRELPFLWSNDNLPSLTVKVRVKMELPE